MSEGMGKTQVVYGREYNPNSRLVDRIAIQMETRPPYVWRTFQKGDKMHTLSDDMKVLPILQARNVFYFTRRRQHPQARN